MKFLIILISLYFSVFSINNKANAVAVLAACATPMGATACTGLLATIYATMTKAPHFSNDDIQINFSITDTQPTVPPNETDMSGGEGNMGWGEVGTLIVRSKITETNLKPGDFITSTISIEDYKDPNVRLLRLYETRERCEQALRGKYNDMSAVADIITTPRCVFIRY